MSNILLAMVLTSVVVLVSVVCGMMWERWTWLSRAHDDTDHIWNSATRKLITDKGVNLTQDLESEINFKTRGLAMIKTCQIIKELTNITDPVEKLILEKSKIACEMYEQKIEFINGFLKFHQTITKIYNLKTGIATNADDATLEIAKRKLKLENLFGKHIYNISHVNNVYKPNPDLYLHAAKQLGLDPKECVAIEDSAHGVKAAKSAGMFCIGINTSKNKKFLEESDFIIDHYDEIDLMRLLKK